MNMRHPLTAIPDGINNLSDRAAMGLSEGYVAPAVEAAHREFVELSPLSSAQLVAIAEDPERDLKRRLAAGMLLALKGDPRIDVLDPAMVTIPGGDVAIGLEPGRVAEVVARYARFGVLPEWIEKETPRFHASIDTFRMARYPVTNAEYLEFLKDSSYPEVPTSWRFGGYPIAAANHPVWTVSAEAADAFVRWLAGKTGRRFRLPTEIEWEFAAAGPEGREFPWGNEDGLDRANTVEEMLLDSTPIGIFPRGDSYFGLSDMAGNVEEYVADDYWAYPGGAAVRDDLLHAVPVYRVARGGSFTRFRDLARCRRRHGRYPRDLYVMGFRVAEALGG